MGLLVPFHRHLEVPFTFTLDQAIFFFDHVSDFSINILVSVSDFGAIVGSTHAFIRLQEYLVDLTLAASSWYLVEAPLMILLEAKDVVVEGFKLKAFAVVTLV